MDGVREGIVDTHARLVGSSSLFPFFLDGPSSIV